MRRRSFLLLCAALASIVALSLIIASLNYHKQLSDYQQYAQTLAQSGGAAAALPPQLSPLQQLRGSIEYIEIIGPVLAIVAGYGIVAKEKYRGTLRLFFSRPIGALDLAAGKLAALALLWLIIILVLLLVMATTLHFVGGALFSASTIAKLVLSLAAAWAYLMFWSALALGLTCSSKHLGSALLISFIAWLAVVLLLPQIGDTMDPDNQVPGGLFQSMHVDKSHEHAIMAHFGGYESARNALEETSISKHFERASFAFLGVKQIYNQQPVGYIWGDTWKDTALLLTGLLASAAFALTWCNKRNLIGRSWK